MTDEPSIVVMAQMQGRFGNPAFFAGKQLAGYEVGALAEKLR